MKIQDLYPLIKTFKNGVQEMQIISRVAFWELQFVISNCIKEEVIIFFYYNTFAFQSVFFRNYLVLLGQPRCGKLQGSKSGYSVTFKKGLDFCLLPFSFCSTV